MKSQLIAIVAAVLLVGCGESQQSPTVEPAEPVAEVPSQQSAPPAEVEPVESVAEAVQPELPTAKPPDISIHDAARDENIEAVKQHLDAEADVNAKDDNGTTPLDRATMPNSPFNTTETANLLRQHGGKTGEELKAEGK